MSTIMPLHILHLSDLHFGSSSRFVGSDHRELGKRFYQAIQDELRHRGTNANISVVIITGDIAESGLPREYQLAKDFFEGLAGELGLERRYFIFLPGNHDICWPLSKQAELEQQIEGFSDAEFRSRMDAYKFKFFNEFIANFYGPSAGNQEIALENGARISSFEDLRLSIAALNSCEIESHLPGDHRGFLSEKQVQSVMTYWRGGGIDDWVKIVALHHNPVTTVTANIEEWKSYLRQKGEVSADLIERFAADVAGVEGRDYLKRLSEECEVQLVLHGHHHATEQQSWPWKTSKGHTQILSAGSWGVMPTKLPGDEPNTFQIIQINVEKEELRPYILRYEPRALVASSVVPGQFIRDTAVPENFCLALSVPSGFKRTAAKKGARKQTRDLSSFIREYKQRLSSLYSRWDLAAVGVTQAGGAEKPIVADLDEMYLPLRLAESYDIRQLDRGRDLPPDMLLRRKKPLAIRGPAGSGKTTWMRWTFRRLLSNEGALPIMVELRRLARTWQKVDAPGEDRSLDAYLENWVAEHLGGGWRGWMPEVLKRKSGPRPVLLVDGWDELGELGEELRGKLLGFIRSHPRILVVVTSRPYGQGRPSNSEGFEVLDIQPLSDTEIEGFSSQFFIKCYSKDRQAITESGERFLAALKRSPDATSLARTALLLTMMLLISRSRPLPDKRHQLYQACIDNLLTALPDRKQEEGAQLLREQWRPDDSEERLRVVAKMAYEMQQLGYETSGRTQIVRGWDELAGLLPKEWKPQLRTGFIAWLAGPAGLLVDRADGTVSFAHLSFQEYLVAWHLQAIVEGNQARINSFRGKLQSQTWWETLRLWAALVEGRNPDQLKPVLKALMEDEGGIWLAGAMLADGLGSETEFAEWGALFKGALYVKWTSGVDQCVQAWASSRQDARRLALRDILNENSSSLVWTQWVRYKMWFDTAKLSGAFPLPAKHANSRILAEVISDVPTAERQFAVGRIFINGSPCWPASPPELVVLRTWPTHRQIVGNHLQVLASLPIGRSELLEKAGRLIKVRKSDVAGNVKLNQRTKEYLLRVIQNSPPHSSGLQWHQDLIQDMFNQVNVDQISRFFSPGFFYETFDLFRFSMAYGAKEMLSHAQTLNWFWARNLASGELRNYGFFPRRLFDASSPSNECVVSSTGYYQPRALLAHLPVKDTPLLKLFSLACQVSLHPERSTVSFKGALTKYSRQLAPLWPALARHIARMSTEEDRALLNDLARHPESLHPPLRWGLQYLVRGDIVMDDGSIITIDEVTSELGLRPLPYLEEMPREVKLNWDDILRYNRVPLVTEPGTAID